MHSHGHKDHCFCNVEIPFVCELLNEDEPSVDTYPYSYIIGTLRSDDGDGYGNATKAKSLISKTTILHVHHAFLYISLPSLHDYDVKMLNFTMYRGSTQATTRFPLSF